VDLDLDLDLRIGGLVTSLELALDSRSIYITGIVRGLYWNQNVVRLSVTLCIVAE